MGIGRSSYVGPRAMHAGRPRKQASSKVDLESRPWFIPKPPRPQFAAIAATHSLDPQPRDLSGLPWAGAARRSHRAPSAFSTAFGERAPAVCAAPAPPTEPPGACGRVPPFHHTHPVSSHSYTYIIRRSDHRFRACPPPGHATSIPPPVIDRSSSARGVLENQDHTVATQEHL